MKKIFISLVLVVFAFSGYAQQVILSAGGDATGNGGDVSYAIGQIFYSENSDGNTTITEGVLHPVEISVITGVEDDLALKMDLSVYPNPTADQLQLSIKDYNNSSLISELHDLKGRLIDKRKVTSSLTRFQISDYPPGIYFLKVLDENNAFKTFKIIKN